ncbi:phospholipase/carboxylesterase [Xylona heveae TC161]|uniref:Phospholipase/carboxylesterase n=1 Tax=Xylona heveae (strain CBS 132557 / TC161) TaxID=1328760 RepID=A0A165FHQ1_XYLHT|nr:phospholipase/carboxylesterase [Xylona heveae TC161]KZF20991.1 phospholipase/carboxylesterase [Xylona heveae TC161]
MSNPMNEVSQEVTPSRGNAAHPPPFICLPKSEHTHTAILLHGLGSNGEKFGTELLQTGISSTGATLPDLFPGMKFVFPTAKRRRSSAFKRSVLTQWFDILSLEDPSKRRDLQIDGLSESVSYLLSLLRQETQAISPQNVILGGISQGCATAFFVLLSLEFPVGAFIGISGYLPFRVDIHEILSCDQEGESSNDDVFAVDDGEDSDQDPSIQAINFVRDILSLDAMKFDGPGSCRTRMETPIFLGHGEQDAKVSCRLGSEAASTIASVGFDVTWKSYPDLGHWYKVPDEIDDVVEFLQQKLS